MPNAVPNGLMPLLHEFVAANRISRRQHSVWIFEKQAARALKFFHEHRRDFQIKVLFDKTGEQPLTRGISNPNYPAGAESIREALMTNGIPAETVAYGPGTIQSLAEGPNIVWMHCPLWVDKKRNASETVKELANAQIPHLGHSLRTHSLAINRYAGREVLASNRIDPFDCKLVQAGKQIVLNGGSSEPMMERPALGRGGSHRILEGKTTISSDVPLILEKLYTGREGYLIMGTHFYHNDGGEFEYHDNNLALPLAPDGAPTDACSLLQLKFSNGSRIFEMRQGESLADRSMIVRLTGEEARKVIHFAQGIFSAYGCANVVGIQMREETPGGKTRFIDIDPILDLGAPDASNPNALSILLGHDYSQYSGLIWNMFLNGLIHILTTVEGKMPKAPGLVPVPQQPTRP